MTIRLELKKTPDGRLRPDWYGIHEQSGKRRVVTLNRWRGEPPAIMTAKARGDDDFEASRVQAMEKARRVFNEEATAAEQEVEARRVYRARYRQSVPIHRLSQMAALWDGIPKKRKPGAGRIAVAHLYLSRFVAFMAEIAPDVSELGAVTTDHLEAYREALPGIAGAARSCDEHISVLRRVYRYAAPASVACGYLGKIPGAEGKSVHREPFTPKQLRAVYEAVQADELLRPLVVCAACTAMRRKDVALLKWKSVNLADAFIDVTASKTGTTCEIPIFPELMAELETAAAKVKRPAPEAYVWPRAAALYDRNPDGLNDRLNVILEQAGFDEEDTKGELLPGRKKRPSLRGWHTFKTTWITLALTSGIPMEIVCRVAGNKSVDVVLKHYFRPGREAMREVFNKSMPALLGEGKRPALLTRQTVGALAAKLNAKTWRAVKAELAALAQ